MNYDQLPTLIENGFDWSRSTVYALLYEDAVFDAEQTRVSEIPAKILRRVSVEGRYVTDDGNLAGNSVAFSRVSPEVGYQLILGWDNGNHDELLLGFYDQNTEGAPLEVQRHGSMIVRPLAEDTEDVPHYGLWLLT
jgi:hypothetical protein